MPPHYIASRGNFETKLHGDDAVVDVRIRAALDELLPLPIGGLVVAASVLCWLVPFLSFRHID